VRTGDTDIDRGETSCGRVDVEVEVAMDVEVEDSAVENIGQPR
jgi:hypothetical protein